MRIWGRRGADARGGVRPPRDVRADHTATIVSPPDRSPARADRPCASDDRLGARPLPAPGGDPAVRRRAARDAPAMRAIARRFGIGSAVALVVIIATGAAMASH